jgi:hypothetical protein
MKPAETIAELYQTINPDEPLSPADSRFVDFSPARGCEDFVALITRRVTTARPPNYHRRLVTGHRGSGKSTELLRLQASLEAEGFLVAYLDVENTLDLADLEYLDVLLAVAYRLDAVAREKKLKIKPELIEDVGNWFAEVVLTKEQQKGAELTVGADFGLGGEAPLLAKMLASVTGQIRSGSTTRKEIRQKLEQRLEDLISRLVTLVDNITVQAGKKGLKGLFVIVDSMEKMPIKMLDQSQTNHSLLFIEHAEQLKSLPCHLIATVPVSLVSDRNLGIAFTDIDLIPMVKIITVEQKPAKEGRDILFDAVARRASTERIFSSPKVVYQLIDASGGVVRDLMRLLLFAADYTALESKITEAQAEQAIQKLVREYDRLIHEDDLPVLLEVTRNPHLPSSATLSRLMYNRLVLPYINKEQWIGLHPAVHSAPTFRAALKVGTAG